MKAIPTVLAMMFALLCLGAPGAIQAGDKGIAAHNKVDKSLPVYNRTLSAIMSEENSNVGNCIVLDDGSAWIVKGYEHGSDRHLTTWIKGVPSPSCGIQKVKEGYLFFLTRTRYGQPMALLDPQTINCFPYVTEVIDGGAKIKLSDHSIWKITWWGRSSTKKWDMGQQS